MADGSKKPIEDVKVGDEVLATDPETGEQAPKKVEHVFVHHDIVIDLIVDGEVITTTEDHPFWSVTDQRFDRADQLQPGDRVLSASGEYVKVQGLQPGTMRADLAYNLSVEGIHTYHVGHSEVLVHNECPLPKITEAGLSQSFDRHAAQWFGGSPSREGQMTAWRGLVERAAGSSKVVPWSSGSTPTYAHLARIEGKYFVAQFSRESGDLVTAFVPNNAQLGAMLRGMGHR